MIFEENKVYSSPSLSIRFSNTDSNFYKNKQRKTFVNRPSTKFDYKSLFKYFYKNKNQNKLNSKDSHHEINNYYLKCQNTVKNYFSNDNNKFGLKLDGNKNFENYSLKQFNNLFNKACSAREQILQKELLNYYYPKDNIDKLMGEKMKLTPIPSKRDAFFKNEKEKEEYLKAKRSAVCMRRLEYTHGLKKNNSQEFRRTNYNNRNNNINFLSILKGAVLIIEDWWIKILHQRNEFIENEIDAVNFIGITGRGSTNSIEKKILKNLNTINSNTENDFIENWITRQSQRKIQKNEQDYNNFKDDNSYFSYLTSKRPTKNKTITKNNFKYSMSAVKSKNNSEIKSFNSNKRYVSSNKNKNSKKKKIINQKQNQKNPIKVIQNSISFPIDYNSSVPTVVSPSNYLQNYFKDYCLNNHFSNNNCSNRKLKSFELIENKYKNNYSQRYDNLPSFENANIILNNPSEIIDNKIEEDDKLKEEINDKKTILRSKNKVKNNENPNEIKIDNDNNNNNLNADVNSFKNNINLSTINQNDDNNNNINNNNLNTGIISEKNKNNLNGINQYDNKTNNLNNDLNIENNKNNLNTNLNSDKNNNNLDIININDDNIKKLKKELTPNKNNLNNVNQNNEDKINLIKNLNLDKNNNKIDNINANNENKNNFKTEKYINNLNIINKNNNYNKDVSTETDPIPKIKMINTFTNTNDDINSNININEIIRNNLKKSLSNNNIDDHSKNKYQVKYNIIKNLKSKFHRQNSMSEKSSMDGSVDEIITKKLEEIHKKNQKYANRIKKAYNEVQSTKNNKKKETPPNNVEMNISNRSDSIHYIDENDY